MIFIRWNSHEVLSEITFKTKSVMQPAHSWKLPGCLLNYVPAFGVKDIPSPFAHDRVIQGRLECQNHEGPLRTVCSVSKIHLQRAQQQLQARSVEPHTQHIHTVIT